MNWMKMAPTRRRCGVLLASAMAMSMAMAPAVAQAHFILQAPPSWMSQDSAGAPEKLGPCGNEAGGTATGIVTAFQEGQTITVTINEVVFHPGHYRVALSVNSRSELPAEPVVTATSSTPCGSVPIQSSPTFPVLADGVLQHTAAFASPQSFQVTLPSGVTCTHCTLQIIEFMSNHPLNNPGGCFYHHCADIAIQPVAGNAGTGGATGMGTVTGSVGGVSHGSGGQQSAGSPSTGGSLGLGGTTGTVTPESNVGSCSCSIPSRSGHLGFVVAAVGTLAGVFRTRSRRRA